MIFLILNIKYLKTAFIYTRMRNTENDYSHWFYHLIFFFQKKKKK